MEEAGSILKECADFIGQASATVPRSIKIAQPGKVGGAASGTEGILVPCDDKEEPMDVSVSKNSKVNRCLGCAALTALCFSAGWWQWGSMECGGNTRCRTMQFH